MGTSVRSIARLRKALDEMGEPLYVVAGRMREATKGKVKTTPGDLGRIVSRRMVPTVGEKLAIAQVLEKPLNSLWSKEEPEDESK